MEIRSRRNLRLPNFDYVACGAYFVTICTYRRRELLSKIRRGDPCGRPEICLLPLGRIAAETFRVVEEKYGIQFDTWIIMPDHIHFVVFLPGSGVNIGRIVGAYKSIISRQWLLNS